MKFFFDMVLGLVSLVIVAITSPLLFWLGSASVREGELVVDGDLLVDDPGIDVDGPYQEPA